MQGYVSASGNLNAVYSQISANPAVTLGWTFQPQTDIDVTALGAFNDTLQRVIWEILKTASPWNSSGDLLTLIWWL